jgi:hypothetical protein
MEGANMLPKPCVNEKKKEEEKIAPDSIGYRHARDAKPVVPLV